MMDAMRARGARTARIAASFSTQSTNAGRTLGLVGLTYPRWRWLFPLPVSCEVQPLLRQVVLPKRVRPGDGRIAALQSLRTAWCGTRHSLHPAAGLAGTLRIAICDPVLMQFCAVHPDRPAGAGSRAPRRACPRTFFRPHCGSWSKYLPRPGGRARCLCWRPGRRRRSPEP